MRLVKVGVSPLLLTFHSDVSQNEDKTCRVESIFSYLLSQSYLLFIYKSSTLCQHVPTYSIHRSIVLFHIRVYSFHYCRLIIALILLLSKLMIELTCDECENEMCKVHCNIFN